MKTQDEWISSVEILNKTGISRATLNNYIKMGMIPKPFIRKPYEPHIKAKKIGYFPQEILERISSVKIMKKTGKSMKSIINELAYKKEVVYERKEEKTIGNSVITPTNLLKRDEDLKLTIADIKCPAYLLNNNLQLEWLNQSAEINIFKQNVRQINDIASRNIFKILSQMGLFRDNYVRNELVDFHISLLKPKYEKNIIKTLYEHIKEKEITILENVYDSVWPSPEAPIQETYINVDISPDVKTSYHVYRIYFREGILIIFEPVNGIFKNINEILSNRAGIINELLKNRLKTLVSFCVLVADVQDSTRICSELTPEEYFELMTQIWECMEDSFKHYYGTYGKHAGDGMVYFFLKNSDSNYILNAIYCALELKRKIKKLSEYWKAKKGWFNDIYLNIGINEGKEYLVNIPTSPNIEFTVLGDSVNYASRLSDIARYGSIWTTKNVISKVTIDERSKLQFGIRKKTENQEIFIDKTFSRVMDMLDDKMSSKYKDIWTLSITEIVD
jgi:class 3 adenylate cyclase/predicted DNA-binding transcriptional regulator AlpA